MLAFDIAVVTASVCLFTTGKKCSLYNVQRTLIIEIKPRIKGFLINSINRFLKILLLHSLVR